MGLFSLIQHMAELMVRLIVEVLFRIHVPLSYRATLRNRDTGDRYGNHLGITLN